MAITVKELKSTLKFITKDIIQYWVSLTCVISSNYSEVAKGKLLHTVDKWKAEKSVLLSHLKTHKKSVKNLSIRYDELLEKLKSKIGELLSNFIVVHLNNVLRYTNTQQLPIKNNKQNVSFEEKGTTY